MSSFEEESLIADNGENLPSLSGTNRDNPTSDKELHKDWSKKFVSKLNLNLICLMIGSDHQQRRWKFVKMAFPMQVYATRFLMGNSLIESVSLLLCHFFARARARDNFLEYVEEEILR